MKKLKSLIVFLALVALAAAWMLSRAASSQAAGLEAGAPDDVLDIIYDASTAITTTTSIFSDDPDPSQVSQPFTVTFGVTSTLGVPTGVVTVTVSDRVEICNTALADGLGACQIALSVPGTYTLTATYGGEGDFLSSNDSEQHTVTPITTITTMITILSDAPDPSRAGEPFTVAYEVTATEGIPTGVVTVTVSEAGETCSGELVDGQGSCQIALSTPGDYTLNANYAGEENFLPSSASELHSVEMRQVHLPMVIKSPEVIPGLTGKVTENGIPATGIPLDLRFYNGTSYSTYASTTTDADGNYLFSQVPALQPGQNYYVRYRNLAYIDTRLAYWHTADNVTYNGTTLDSFTTFDIANIILSTPDPEARVNLPVTFTWIPRPASPTDSYEFDLFDPEDDNTYFYTDPPLGYVGSYTLQYLPGGFRTGVEYGWYVMVISPEGGFGGSYYYYPITFK